MRIHEDKTFAVLRIVFGIVWAIDASFKWSPAFIDNLTSYLAQGAQGQPALVQWWVNLWIQSVSIDPHLFAVFVALAESAIAIGLIFGFMTRVAIAGGIAMSFVIWSTAEGFGGPYAPGSTDIGAAVIYIIVFVALWLGHSARHYSLDTRLARRLPVLFGE